MATDAQLTADEQERLSAMWEQPLDPAPAGVQSGDDAIAELLASPGGRPTDAARCPPESRARGSAAPPRWDRPRHVRARLAWPRVRCRWIGAGATVIAALMLMTIVQSPSTKSSDPVSVAPRAAADRLTVPNPPPQPRHEELDRRRAETARARAPRTRERQQARGRKERQRARAARRARTAPKRARPRTRAARPTVEPAPQPSQPKATPRPTPPPPSSACDEFPPC